MCGVAGGGDVCMCVCVWMEWGGMRRRVLGEGGGVRVSKRQPLTGVKQSLGLGLQCPLHGW